MAIDQRPNHDVCGHHPAVRPAPISRLWQWITVGGNGVIGAAEMLSGGASTLSVASDGWHNLGGDMATYYIQADVVRKPHMAQERQVKLRKVAHWLIATTSVAVSVKAGADWLLDQAYSQRGTALYASGASLALSGAMLASFRRGLRRRGGGSMTPHEHDLSKHFWRVDIPSAGLAVAGAVLQKYNVDLEQAAAFASGGLGAYVFRPTRKNLASSCIGHGHSPGEHSHTTPAPPPDNWLGAELDAVLARNVVAADAAQRAARLQADFLEISSNLEFEWKRWPTVAAAD